MFCFSNTRKDKIKSGIFRPLAMLKFSWIIGTNNFIYAQENNNQKIPFLTDS